MGDKKTFLLTPCSGRTFCYRSPITDQLLCQLITDHRSPPITDHRSIVVSIDHRSSITSDHRSIVRFYASCSRISRTIIDHLRSPIIDHRSIVRFYASCSRISRTIIDHRSSITNRSTGSKQLYRSPIIDHRGNISLRILCTRLPWNHRSPIIDHKPLNRFQTVVSITDHRSPMKHKSTHFMYQTAVESSITDHRSQTAQPVPNSCIDHRSSITNRSTGSKQLKTNRSFNRFQTVEDQPFIQPGPNSLRPTVHSTGSKQLKTNRSTGSKQLTIINKTHTLLTKCLYFLSYYWNVRN